PPLWMLRHRLWLAFIAYLIAIVALELALAAVGASRAMMIAAAVLLSVLVGLDAPTLRRLALGRRRWSNFGTVLGDDLEAAAREEGLAQPILVTSDPEEVRRAERVVLPGVGAFADCRRGLDGVEGMLEALDDSVRRRGRPFLGICVGMQLMAERGREYVVTQGLGWIPGEVERITPCDPTLKIPHMGWNTLTARRPHPLLDGIAVGAQGLHAYFVHSFHLKP